MFRKKHPSVTGNPTTESSRENTYSYRKQYEEIEVVNRAVNMIIDDASSIPVDIGEKIGTPVVPVRKKRLESILNVQPNPYQDISAFRRTLISDLILDGNIFIYFDGAYLYHLPASKVTIVTDPVDYVKKYVYNGEKDYYPDEIIHIKENSFFSIYRGISRLKPATSTMQLLSQLKKFQHNFFKNGAVPGLVLKTPDILSDKIKTRLLESWVEKYSPSTGGRRPLILDGGLSLDSLTNVNFKELDFQNACIECEKTILKALGVPPILFSGGNDANIQPNHRLYYVETVIPIVRKINTAYTRFFGYTLREDTSNTPALQPAMRDLAAYCSTLTNGGILTPNEARITIGKPPLDGLDEIRVPVNVAGSNADPSVGGRPVEGEDDE